MIHAPEDVPEVSNNNNNDDVRAIPTTVSETLTCRTCTTTFPDLQLYQAHYKSEWHRYVCVRVRMCIGRMRVRGGACEHDLRLLMPVCTGST